MNRFRFSFFILLFLPFFLSAEPKVAVVPETDAGTPESLQVVWDSTPGGTYLLEESDDLSTWTPVPGFPALAAGSQSAHAFSPATSGRFFRVNELGPQRFNLPDAPAADRFPLPSGLVWPAEIGEADVCLWNDDKFAAMSITVDDNNAPDWPWWLTISAQYDFPVTWFAITERVSGTNAFYGTWEGLQDLVHAGHFIGSHSATHGPSPTDADYVWEYEFSQDTIEANLTGQWAGCLAYPGGTGTGPRPDIARDYYIGARGTVGTPNKANRINYLQTNSISGNIGPDIIDSIVFGTSGIAWMDNNAYLRAWASIHFHSVTVDNRPARETEFAYIDSLRSQIWMGSFYDVVRFGQERDTATLTIVSVATDEIRFDLADEMDDTIYDFPLTVKVRIPNDWPAVRASQEDRPLRAWIVDHEGNQYALVKAVPDQGRVTLENNTTGNLSPVAIPGPDLVVNDHDGDNLATVRLNGAASFDPDGTITGYDWSEEGSPLASGKRTTADLAVGVHLVSLTVEDDMGATGTRTFVITVTEKENDPPVADAGVDLSGYDFDGSGSEEVSFDGSGSSDPDGTIVAYSWLLDAVEVATTAQVTLDLAVGTHTLTLVVTDDKGATDTDTVSVTVVGGPVVPLDNIYSISADKADRQVYSDGTMRGTLDKNHRVGGATSLDGAGVHPFQLPALAPGESVEACLLTFYIESIGAVSSNLDVYALPYRSTPDVVPADFFQGAYGTDATSGVVALQDDVASPYSTSGSYTLSGDALNRLAAFIQDQYDAGAVAGDYIFIRFNVDIADEGNYKYYLVSSADSLTPSWVPVMKIGTRLAP